MPTSTLRRYRNLLRNVRNWPRYFLQKTNRTFVPVEFVTRGEPLRFHVTSKRLFLVFKEIFLSDFYSMNALARDLPKGAVVVDVGANAGYFSLLLLSRRPDVHVHAFEPVAGNHDLFARNLTGNPALVGSVSLRHAAVTGSPVASVELFREPDGETSVTASVYSGFKHGNDRSERVPAVPLSSIIGQLPRVDLLKLDCEGSEYPILYETPPLVLRTVRAITMEAHDLDGAALNARALAGHLESLGYRCSASAAPNGCTALFASLG